jgi:hypothetical protein
VEVTMLELIEEALMALSELDEARDNWEKGDIEAEIRFDQAATYEAVIHTEINRADWDALIHATKQLRKILAGN